jgi:hypothetical protein
MGQRERLAGGITARNGSMKSQRYLMVKQPAGVLIRRTAGFTSKNIKLDPLTGVIVIKILQL